MKEISKKRGTLPILDKPAKNWAYTIRYDGKLEIWDSKDSKTFANFIQNKTVWLGLASIVLGILLIAFGAAYFSIICGTILGYSVVRFLKESNNTNYILADNDTWLADAIKRGHKSILLDGMIDAWFKSAENKGKYFWGDSFKKDLLETWELSEKVGDSLETEVKTMLMKNITPPQSKEAGYEAVEKLKKLKKTLKETVAAKAIVLEEQEKAKNESTMLDLDHLIEKVEVEKEVFTELANERNEAAKQLEHRTE